MHGYKWPINCTRTRTEPALLLVDADEEANVDDSTIHAALPNIWLRLCGVALTMGIGSAACDTAIKSHLSAHWLGETDTGACPYNRPCAQQYIGKYQSCMVISGRLIVRAPVQPCCPCDVHERSLSRCRPGHLRRCMREDREHLHRPGHRMHRRAALRRHAVLHGRGAAQQQLRLVNVSEYAHRKM